MAGLLSIVICYILTLVCVLGGLLAKGKWERVRILSSAWRLLVVTCLFTVPVAMFRLDPLLIFAGYLGFVVILSGFPLNLFPSLLNWAVVLEEPIQSPQRNAGSRPSSDDSSASETPSSLGPRG